MGCHNRAIAHERISSYNFPLLHYPTQNSHVRETQCDWSEVPYVSWQGQGSSCREQHLLTKAIPLENLYTLIKSGEIGCWAGKINNYQINREQNKNKNTCIPVVAENRLSTFIPQLLIECLQSVRHSAQIKTGFSFTLLPVQEGYIMKRDL